MTDNDSLSIREWRLLYSASIKRSPVYSLQLKALGFANEAESLRQRGVFDYFDASKSYQLNQYGEDVVRMSVEASPSLALTGKQLLFDPPGVR